MPATSKAQFVRYFGPLLDALRSLGGSAAAGEATEKVAEDLGLSEAEQNDLLESGTSRFANNVAWARFYLVKEGLLDASKRGIWSLTEQGKTARLTEVDAGEIFRRWSKKYADERKQPSIPSPSVEDDEEATDGESEFHHREQLRTLLLGLPASGFEQLCQRLLRESGFTQVNVTGKSGDGGIDGYGVLQINPLVSFKVLFQCKRYKDTVSSPVVRDFRGAMQGRADKGMIITTGTFTRDAKHEAVRDGVPPIELISGEQLLEMFEQLELGLKPRTVYDLDHEFFRDFGYSAGA